MKKYSEQHARRELIAKQTAKDYKDYKRQMGGTQRNVYFDHLETHTDENGVVQSNHLIKSREPVSDAYIMLYYKRILAEYMPPSGYDAYSRLLMAMAEDIHFAKYNTNDDTYQEQIIFINNVTRPEYAELLGVSERRITQMIKDLCDAKILRQVKRGAYVVNPYCIGKGEWKDILKIREVWDVEEYDLVHKVTVTQQKDDGTRLTKQVTQRGEEQPTVQQVEEEPEEEWPADGRPEPIEGQISMYDLKSSEGDDTRLEG